MLRNNAKICILIVNYCIVPFLTTMVYADKISQCIRKLDVGKQIFAATVA